MRVEVTTQGLVFTGDDNPMTKLLLQMLGAVAEFELATIRERQAEGIAKAKAAGKYKGRKAALTPEQAQEIARRHAGGAGRGDHRTGQGVRRLSADGLPLPGRGPVAATA